MDEIAGRTPTTVDPRDSKSRQMLARYRERLLAVQQLAEADSARSLAAAHHAVSALVDDLTRDITRFYERDGCGDLTPLERAEVLPCVARLRDILRHRRDGREQLRDTLRRACIRTPELELRLT